VVVAQGDICWADLGPPVGAGPGFRHPLVVIQGDSLNQSGLRTTICVLITSNLRLASAYGNVVLRAAQTGLPRDSVANVSQLLTVDKHVLEDPVGHLGEREIKLILTGLDIVLGR
jgi:mRNA interferase MazF